VPHIWDVMGAGKTTPIVDILIPINGDISTEWSHSLDNLDIGGESYKIIYHRGDTCDAAREILVQKSLLNKSEWMFFLDSDVLPPYDIIATLMSHDLPIVSGIYNSKSPALPWSMWNFMWAYNEAEVTTPVLTWDERLIEVDAVGFGCVLIKKSVVLDIISKYPELPLFLFTKGRFNGFIESLKVPDERMRYCSEDFWFCLLAKACGYKIMVDTEAKCSHHGRFKITNGLIDSGVI